MTSYFWYDLHVDDLSTLGSLGSLGSLGPALRAIASTPDEVLVRGTVIDEQYEIERVLGSGTMGLVYLARDRRLERDIAIKVTKESSPKALAYASREAVTLARISHPNVVGIYQVGELGGRIYVAMEYVAGTTAREWATIPRSVHDVLALYLAVGEGLAAAHAAGIVHRDFKPDNILVGTDGRARVADFGLAHGERGPDEPATVGTPAYMPPEQHGGGTVDARSDQFAFCASLWEALAGQRPFRGESLEALREAIEKGVPPPDDTKRMPRHVEATLRRGLAADCGMRWPSLVALLAELRRDPARRKRQALIAVPAFAVILVGGFALHGQTEVSDACGDGATRIAREWNSTRVEHFQTYLAPITSWDRAAVRSALERTTAWSMRWAASYKDVCHAGWSSSLHDRGMLCLSRAEHGLSAMLAAFGPKVISKLDKVLGELPRPEACTDPSYVEADTPPPQHPALALAMSTFDTELQFHNALEVTGQLARAQRVLHDLEHRTVLDPGARAKLDLARGLMMWMFDEPGTAEMLQQAYFEARAAGMRATASRAAVHLSMQLLDRSKLEEAALWAQLSITEGAELGNPEVTVPTLIAQASVDIAQNKPEHAITLMTRAIAMLSDTRSKLYADALMNRADAYNHRGDFTLALADAEKVRAIYAKLSDANVAYAAIEITRTNILLHAGQIDEALEAARHAVEMAEKLVADDNTIVGAAKGALGTALEYAHHYDEALVMLHASLAVDLAQGPRSYNVASDHNNICDLLVRMHRDTEALAECRLAIELWPDSTGPDSAELAESQVNLGSAQLEQRAFGASLVAFDRAVTILSVRPDDARVVGALVLRAEAHRALDQFGEARKDLAQAAPLVAHPGPKDWPFRYDLELGYLELHDGHSDRARVLAIIARDGFATLHDPLEAEAARLATR